MMRKFLSPVVLLTLLAGCGPPEPSAPVERKALRIAPVDPKAGKHNLNDLRRQSMRIIDRATRL